MTIARRRVSKVLSKLHHMPDAQRANMLRDLDTIASFRNGNQRPMRRASWMHKRKGMVSVNEFDTLEQRIHKAQSKLQDTFFRKLWARLTA
jgi:hypothetical protein